MESLQRSLINFHFHPGTPQNVKKVPLARSRETPCFTRPNRRACSQATTIWEPGTGYEGARESVHINGVSVLSPEGVLPRMLYMGICHWTGYDFRPLFDSVLHRVYNFV